MSKFLILYLVLFACGSSARTSFKFPVYQYKRKATNEQLFQKVTSDCNDICSLHNSGSLEHTKCIRLCISETCYKSLYGFDELEEGEIDVRFSSFKGCVLQKLKEKGFRVI
ncbi:unnamed protein product [Schistosoma turkestanicum]|nr:unnamed protein product [Schistosoma turkestanicum]CAH8555051.1 unnamed protein product [Schistosoma turkestanicum]